MIGRTLSHYRIADEIGAGGMGVVYRARDTLLERTVALKVLPTDAVADSERQRRFLQEARAASALNHPNIVTIHDILHEDGVHAIVMELIDGMSLQNRLRGGPLPVGEALSVARQIADALAAAHAAGIVHRDLKPANVMVSGRGQVKVLDFGIAKLDPARGSPDDGTQTASLTMAGAIIGTAAYMSPEQARGEPVDARTDVFALGVVLYEMLSGRSPFAAASITAMLHKLLYEEPPDLSTLNVEIPPAVWTTLQRALAKHPSVRFQTIDAMAAALDILIAGRSTSAGLIQSVLRRPSRWSVRPRVALAAGALALALCGAAGGWAMGWFARDPAANDEALAAALPSTPYDAYQQGQALLARYDKDGYVDRSIEHFRQAISLSPEYPAAFAGLGAAYWRKYREQRDPMHLTHAAENAARAVQLDPQLSIGLSALAFVRIEQGDLDAAEVLLNDALTRDPGSAEALSAQAYLALRRRHFTDALEAIQAAGRAENDDWSLALMEGVIQLTAGAPADAVRALERAASLAPDSALVHRNLGAAYHATGRHGEATTSFQRALEIKPDPAVYNNLGTLLFFRGLYSEAVDAFNRAVDRGANEYRTWGNLADAYRFVPGREEDARDAYTTALRLLDAQLSKAPEDPDLSSRRIAMLAKRGDCTEAMTAADGLLRSIKAQLPMYRLGVAYEVCGRREAALEAVIAAINAGYSVEQVQQDPELVRLRAEARYQRFLSTRPVQSSGKS